MELNLPILELAFVHQVFYDGDDDDRKRYHFKVSYLCKAIGAVETVVEVYPTSPVVLKSLPYIDQHTEVTIMRHEGSSCIPAGTFHVRDLFDSTDPTIPMGPNGNVRVD